MKDILLTGNISIVTNDMVKELEKNQRVILCGKTSVSEFHSKRVVVYPYREDDHEYRGIFQSYELETVIYFSKVLDGQKRLYNEIENLENTIYSSNIAGVKHFIYVTTNDYVNQPESTRVKLLHTCEDICKQYSDECNIDFVLLRVPHLFSIEKADCYFHKILEKAIYERVLELEGDKGQITDFLSDEDLGELLSRIVDEPVKGYQEANIGGGSLIKMEEIARQIQKEISLSDVHYKEYKEAVPQCLDDGSMRERYGWFPVKKLEEWMEDIIASIKEGEKKEKKKRKRLLRNQKLADMTLAATEMILLFILSELLNYWTSNFYRIDYVDFRMLFVIIIGTVHGTGAGIIASILAGLGYFAGDIMGSNLQIIFFNIENWLPFAAYFLSGTIVGHIRDKNKENIRFLNEQQKILEKKYVFLNKLYGKTLENKENFSRQIVGYQDSFGKIYQVVRNLNSTVTDRIFYEAVNAMEEILEVTSVAIYTVEENSHFARLDVCSREMNECLAKSIDIANLPHVWESMQQKQNWYNTEGLSEYPMYAAPILRETKLIGMIFLWHTGVSQMNLSYFNKFSIMCGLVQDALLRAITYNETEKAKYMIEGTRILKPEYFEEAIRMKEQLGKDGMMNHILLRVSAEGMDEGHISEMISSGSRHKDVLGKRADGKLYLLLNQADEKSMTIVINRMKPKGILLEKV